MRRILVERARAREAQKQWAGLDRVTLTDALDISPATVKRRWALYLATAILAWQMKEWVETPITVAIFLALGATIGGVLRGHLVFTERMNRALPAVFALSAAAGLTLGSLVLEPRRQPPPLARTCDRD